MTAAETLERFRRAAVTAALDGDRAAAKILWLVADQIAAEAP